MERLFTSITNAEESAKRIKNDLHTGYYAGEREDYIHLWRTEQLF